MNDTPIYHAYIFHGEYVIARLDFSLVARLTSCALDGGKKLTQTSLRIEYSGIQNNEVQSVLVRSAQFYNFSIGGEQVRVVPVHLSGSHCLYLVNFSPRFAFIVCVMVQ